MKQIALVVSTIIFAVNAWGQTTIKVTTQKELLDAFGTINAQPDNDWCVEIAPGVYWLDDPDDPTIRKSEGDPPCACIIRCNNLTLKGTDSNPQNTVLAVNRGQTQGAIGNFTMFIFYCKNINAENLTFGNYCNVDLDYPLNPSLSRKKRAEAIVQAQLALCSGTDSVNIKNCHFISRLNLCNFTGAKNATFENCHLECTDDALAEGIYNHCHLTFYSSKPFYTTSKGAWFNDCDIDIMTKGTQYFTKSPGPIHLKDVRLHSKNKIQLAWCKYNNPEICSAENVTLNGKPAKIDNQPWIPVEQIHEKVGARKVEGGYVYVFDSYKPADTKEYSWQPNPQADSWYWGTAIDGAEGHKGLVQNQRGARIHITPQDKNEKITRASLKVMPCKSAGQGFGSATGQYMDVCIGMDMQTLTGYGLRIERTPNYDHAVEISLIKYKNGSTEHITVPVKCEQYKTPCIINIEYKNDKLTASLKNSKTQKLAASIRWDNIGQSFMLQHTGTVGASATLIEEIKITN